MLDPQTELLMKMLDTVRADMAAGFSGVHSRLDRLNGQTARHGNDIAVLQERTDGMVCIEHAERFKAIEKAVERIEANPPSRVKSWAISGGAVAGAIALLEGFWNWLK